MDIYAYHSIKLFMSEYKIYSNSIPTERMMSKTAHEGACKLKLHPASGRVDYEG